MKVSYNWLKDYINIRLKPNDLADRLTMAGLEVKSINARGGDSIFEIEVTSNRPDCLSIYGIAREIQGIFGLNLKPIKTGLLKNVRLEKPPIKIEDKKGCLRYVGRVIAGIKVQASPKWLVDKIESAGLRPVNNIVDITNFCLLELGQPLHAFDYDRLTGGEIIVRKARQGEEIVTIDGIKRRLDADVLVIADAEKTVAIAGVMGGKDTEVTSSTKRVLLESAYFDPPRIRRASKGLGISTESSYRFERGVDLEGLLSASNRAASFICNLAKAKAVSQPADVGIKKTKKAKINLRILRANKILGMDIAISKYTAILKRLDLKVKQKGKDLLEIAVPSFRGDLKEEIDLIEEVARLYGYDKIPETLTKITIWGKGRQRSDDKIIEDLIRQGLVELGLNEVITYGLGSADSYTKKLNFNDEQLLKVKNPLSSEAEILRPSLLPGILDVVVYNMNRKITDLRIFELGNSYFCKEKGTPYERSVLAIALCGMRAKDWQKKEELDVFDLKGIVEALFKKLGISKYEFVIKPVPLLTSSASSVIRIGSKDIGILGRLDRVISNGYDIKDSVFISELDLKSVMPHIKLECTFRKLPKFPSITRDISLIVDEKVSNSEIATLIKETCGDLVVSIKPFDLYRGEQVPKGSKSILYSIEYRAPDKTLTDEEVNDFDRNLRTVLTERLHAKIR